MKISMTGTFKRAAKKCHRNQIVEIEAAIEQLKANPFLGEVKHGDLAGIRVFKFTMLNQLILLAYTYDEQSEAVLLLAFAPHENFYQALKVQLKS